MKTKTLLTAILLCFFFDMSAQVSANAGPDREICISDTLNITGSGLNSGDTGSYQWKDLSTNIIVSNNAQLTVKITSLPKRSYGLTVTRKTYNNTYYAYDTVNVTVNALPTFALKALPPRCYADGPIFLTLNEIVTAKSGDGTVSETDIHYYQQYKNPSWVTGGPVGVKGYVYDFPKFVTNSAVPKTGLRDTICYEYTDYKGCYNQECKAIRLNPNPVAETTNGIFCQRAGKVVLDKLVTKPFSKVGGIQSFRCVSVPQGSGVNPNSIISVNTSVVPNTNELDPGTENEPERTGEYVIEYCFKDAITGCQSCDTSIVGIMKLPILKFSGIPEQCINGSQFALDSFLTDSNTGKRLSGATWKTVEYGGSRDMSNSSVATRINNSTKSQKYFDPSTGAGQYLVKVTDVSAGCPVSDSIEILVNGLPIVEIDLPDTVCSNDSAFNLNNIQPSGSVGTWSGLGVNGRQFIPSTFLSGPFISRPSIKYTYTNPNTGCTSSDSQMIAVQNPGDFTITASPRANVRYRVDFNLSSLTNIDTVNGKFLWDFGTTKSTSPNPRNIFFADSGTHTVYVTANYGSCETVKAVTFTLNYKTVDIHHVDWGNLIMLYPNPAGDRLFVEMPFDARVIVFDINGKKILAETHLAGNKTALDVSKLQPGIYPVSVSSNEGVFWTKILIE